VYKKAAELVKTIRAGHGPRLLHARTYRVKGHVSVDLAAYRDPREVEEALKNDPIHNARRALLARGSTDAACDQMDQQAQAEVQAAMQAANLAPWPDVSAAYTDIQTTGEGQWF
jgi:pyruvate dehydrogenase E1 component alpha subunit